MKTEKLTPAQRIEIYKKARKKLKVSWNEYHGICNSMRSALGKYDAENDCHVDIYELIEFKETGILALSTYLFPCNFIGYIRRYIIITKMINKAKKAVV